MPGNPRFCPAPPARRRRSGLCWLPAPTPMCCSHHSQLLNLSADHIAVQWCRDEACCLADHPASGASRVTGAPSRSTQLEPMANYPGSGPGGGVIRLTHRWGRACRSATRWVHHCPLACWSRRRDSCSARTAASFCWSRSRTGASWEMPLRLCSSPVFRTTRWHGLGRWRLSCACCGGWSGFSSGVLVRPGFRRPGSVGPNRLDGGWQGCVESLACWFLRGGVT